MYILIIPTNLVCLLFSTAFLTSLSIYSINCHYLFLMILDHSVIVLQLISFNNDS